MDAVTNAQAQSRGEARRDAEEQEDDGCEARERIYYRHKKTDLAIRNSHASCHRSFV
jgi:hypothetical protein